MHGVRATHFQRLHISQMMLVSFSSKLALTIVLLTSHSIFSDAAISYILYGEPDTSLILPCSKCCAASRENYGDTCESNGLRGGSNNDVR